MVAAIHCMAGVELKYYFPHDLPQLTCLHGLLYEWVESVQSGARQSFCIPGKDKRNDLRKKEKKMFRMLYLVVTGHQTATLVDDQFLLEYHVDCVRHLVLLQLLHGVTERDGGRTP